MAGGKQWSRVTPALPAILLFAAMNAFYEEMNYRASMLAVLETRGMIWSWLHFHQDVAIFIFLAMGALTPGG